MGYHISILKDENRLPELIALFQTGLGETTAAHWKWRLFTENGQEDQPFAVIIEDKNSIVGVLSILPALYWDGTKHLKYAQLGDWVIDRACRGKGCAKLMYKYVEQFFMTNLFDCFIGFPNQNSYPILKKYGFQDVPGVTCWNTKNRIIYRNIPVGTERKYKDIIYRFENICPEIQTFPKSKGRIYKNHSFMKWKYDLNPDETYKWLSLWQDETCIGYFVYLLTKGRLRTAVNIYDWEYFGTDPGYFRYAVKLLQQEGNFVSFWGRYPDEKIRLLQEADLYDSHADIVCIVKQIADTEIPELTLTRIDTDY